MSSSSSSMRVLLAFRRWSAVRQQQQHGHATVAAAAWPQQQAQARAFWVGVGGGVGGGAAAAAAAISPSLSPWPSSRYHHPYFTQHRLSSSQAAPDDASPQQKQQQRPDGGGGSSSFGSGSGADALEATLVWPPQPSSSNNSHYYRDQRHATAEAVVVVDEEDDHSGGDQQQQQQPGRRRPPAAAPPALRRAPPPPARPAASAAATDADLSDADADAEPGPQRAAAVSAARLHVRAYHVGGEVDVPAFCAAEGPWSLRLLARDHAILRATADADPTEETDLLVSRSSEAGKRAGGEEGGDDAKAATATATPRPTNRSESDERLFVVYRFGSVIFFGSDEAADDRWIRRIRAYTQDPSPEPVSDETTLVVVGASSGSAGGGGGGAGGSGSSYLQQQPHPHQPAAAYPYHGADVFSGAVDGFEELDHDDDANADHNHNSPLLPRGAWFALQPDRVVLRRLDVGNARVISSVLGQSVALEHYHRRVDRAIEALAPILHEIAATGRSRSVASSDRKLLRLIGENSLLYTQVVAKLGLLDTSDAAWGKDRYHSVWRALRADYELDRRFDALNRKLGPMLENAKFVLEVREDKKSERSELIIIALIGMEIVLHVAQHFVPAVIGAVVV